MRTKFPDMSPTLLFKPGVRKRVRRKDLAESFCVNIRTIDYWWRVTKFLPPPHYLGDANQVT